MPHFKDPDGNLSFLENATFVDLLPKGCIEITEAEAAQLRAPTLAQAKTAAWNAIKAERDRRKMGGVKVKVSTTNKWFHSDDASRIQQMGLVMMGATIPSGLQWKTMDGTFVAMDPTVAGNVFASAAANDQAIFAVAEGHRVALETCADPSTYDFSAGWPKIYGE